MRGQFRAECRGLFERNIHYTAFDEGFLATFNTYFHHYLWGTYFGGNSLGTDIMYAIADGPTALFMVGGTNSDNTNFPLVNFPGAYNQITSNGFNGFVSEFDLQQVILASTNDLHNPAQIEFSVFPNPAGDFLNIVVNVKNDDDLKLSIVNCLGQEVYIENFEESSGIVVKNISISNLSDGIYFVKVSSNEKSASKKIVKQ